MCGLQIANKHATNTDKIMCVGSLSPRAKFRRRTTREPNRMQMPEKSFALPH